MIDFINPNNKKVLIKKKEYYIDADGNKFNIKKEILRFVNTDDYTNNFSFQWKLFKKTQIDLKGKKNSESKERFFAVTNWESENLKDINILEAGSGAGRFTHIMLEYTNANIYSFDFSNSVESNYENNFKYQKNLKIFQADIYNIPFKNNSFDKIICLGVLQHTPDIKKSIECLVEKLKVGGEIIIDFYAINGWWTKISAKYLLRPLTKKLDHETLLKIITKTISVNIYIFKFFYFLKIGFLARFLPMCDISSFPKNIDKKTLREMAILDTFDQYSPMYDNPQKPIDVINMLIKNKINIKFSGTIYYGEKGKGYVIRGIKQDNEK